MNKIMQSVREMGVWIIPPTPPLHGTDDLWVCWPLRRPGSQERLPCLTVEVEEGRGDADDAMQMKKAKK